MVLVADRPTVGLLQDRNPAGVAAWTLRSHDAVTTWRAPDLIDNARVTAWAAGALTATCCYADLLFCELARLN